MLALNREEKAAVTTAVSDLRADSVPGQAAVRGAAAPLRRFQSCGSTRRCSTPSRRRTRGTILLCAFVPVLDLTGILTPDGTVDGSDGLMVRSADKGDKDDEGGIDALRSTVVNEVAGVGVVTQGFPLTATLGDIAHAWAEHKRVVQYGTHAIKLLPDSATCTVCITEGRLPVAPRGF